MWGTYATGTVANVWANPNPPNTVFDRWTGDTALLANALAAHTTLVVPATNLTITATYKTVAAWTPIIEVIGTASDGSSITRQYYIPPAHNGIIFRFHGTGGKAEAQFTKVEERAFADDAVATGFAVVALDSADRTNKQWSTSAPPNNLDIQHVQETLTNFVTRGLISASEPVFAQGMSQGGGFAPIISYYLHFQATAIVCAAGNGQALGLTTVPTIWALGQNDTMEDHASFIPKAQASAQALTDKGVAAKVYINPPSPVYSRRFWRIPGLAAADSEAIYASLKSNGLLDDYDFLIAVPVAATLQSALPEAYRSYASAIGAQLNVTYTEHQFFSDFNQRVLAFFAAQRTAPPQTTGRGTFLPLMKS